MFNAEDGQSPDVSMRLYARSVAESPVRAELMAELELAFSDPSTSWRHMLCNEEYEVYDFDFEAEARAYAVKILLLPLGISVK